MYAVYEISVWILLSANWWSYARLMLHVGSKRKPRLVLQFRLSPWDYSYEYEHWTCHSNQDTHAMCISDKLPSVICVRARIISRLTVYSILGEKVGPSTHLIRCEFTRSSKYATNLYFFNSSLNIGILRYDNKVRPAFYARRIIDNASVLSY